MATEYEKAVESTKAHADIEDKLSKKYLDKCGNICPYCDSDNIAAGHGEFDYDVGWRDVVCNNCHKTWTEHFILTGLTPEIKDIEEILNKNDNS